jgi:hypothetical protein
MCHDDAVLMVGDGREWGDAALASANAETLFASSQALAVLL